MTTISFKIISSGATVCGPLDKVPVASLAKQPTLKEVDHGPILERSVRVFGRESWEQERQIQARPLVGSNVTHGFVEPNLLMIIEHEDPALTFWTCLSFEGRQDPVEWDHD